MNSEDKTRARAQELRESILALQRHAQDLLEQLLAIDDEAVPQAPTVEQLTMEDGQVLFIFPPTRFVAVVQDGDQD